MDPHPKTSIRRCASLLFVVKEMEQVGLGSVRDVAKGSLSALCFGLDSLVVLDHAVSMAKPAWFLPWLTLQSVESLLQHQQYKTNGRFRTM